VSREPRLIFLDPAAAAAHNAAHGQQQVSGPASRIAIAQQFALWADTCPEPRELERALREKTAEDIIFIVALADFGRKFLWPGVHFAKAYERACTRCQTFSDAVRPIVNNLQLSTDLFRALELLRPDDIDDAINDTDIAPPTI